VQIYMCEKINCLYRYSLLETLNYSEIAFKTYSDLQ